MKDITKQELEGVQPLLLPESIENKPDPMDKTAIEDQKESFEIINGKVVVREPDIISTLEELEELENMRRHTEDESSEEEQDEDENQAREALNKMLEEFGNVFN